MLVKKTVKNQITLPRKISENFPGVDYFDAEVTDGRIILQPVSVKPISPKDLTGMRAKIARLGLSPRDVEKAIQWARKN